MNLDQFIADMRRILNDPDDPVNNPGMKYSDATLVAHADRHLQSLSRIQVQRDQGYGNTPIVLYAANARQVVNGVWLWTLPHWVANIVTLRELLTPPTSETNLTPYMWSVSASIGPPIERKSKRIDYGWKWDGNRTIQMWGMGSAPNLYLEVAKAPARLFKVTLDQDSPAPGQQGVKQSVIMPQAWTRGVEDIMEGAYINAEVQVTTLADATANVELYGVTRRCIYSKAGQLIDGTRRTTLFFEEDWEGGPSVGDTIQSVIPIADEHIRVLQLRVAWSCFEQLANLPAQKAIQPALVEETKNFIEHITPRDTFQAESWHEPNVTLNRTDYNHDRIHRRDFV